MTAVLWAALVVVALIAASAFGLVMVLARRLRSVEERVNLFLPRADLSLPSPGTPVPAFTATAVDGTRVSEADFTGPDRIIALLTTGCTSCHDQVPALVAADQAVWGRPVVVVIGSPDARSEMVSALAEHVTVLEEEDAGPLATAFDIHEFPTVMAVSNGVINVAEHGMATMLKKVKQPA